MAELNPDDLLSDEKLEELLADVDVPSDLAASLKELSVEHQVERASISQRRAGEQGLWPLLIVAAGLAGIIISISWQHSDFLKNLPSLASLSSSPDEEPDPAPGAIENPATPSIPDAANPDTAIPGTAIPGTAISDQAPPVDVAPPVVVHETFAAAEPVSAKALSDVQLIQQQIDAELHRLKTENLRSELVRLQSNELAFNERETDSMIRALSDQTRVSLGGDADRVDDDMVLVIEKYPDSRGAEIAAGFLSNKN